MTPDGRRARRKVVPLNSTTSLERQQQKLDLAARAAWLYYVANNKQEEISEKLHAQRLVSLAGSEGLI